MACGPCLECCFGTTQSLAHGCSPVVNWIEPYRELETLIDEPTCSVGDLLVSIFKPDRIERDLADRHEIRSSERPLQDVPNRLAIADGSDVEVVARLLAVGASRDERLEEPVNDIG